jgi:hypothetical protein
MTVTYSKIRGMPAVHRWRDGTVATTLPYAGGLPHDLGHWFIECQVDLPWGFWALAGRQAPFASLTLASGRWPRGRHEWLDRVRRRHALAMLHAESQGGAWLVDPTLDVHGDWQLIRDRLSRMYAFDDSPMARLGPPDVERLRAFAQRNATIWEELPEGDSVEVSWPGRGDLAVVPTETRGAVALPRQKSTVVMSHGPGHDPRDPRRRVAVAVEFRRGRTPRSERMRQQPG